MARFGRGFPVPWHQPKAPKGSIPFSGAGAIGVTGTASFAATLTFSGAGTIGVTGSASFTGLIPSTVTSVPTPDVWIAFNPTSGATFATANSQALPATGQSNAYWTNVTTFVRDFQTRSGKQHFLDRMEAGTLSLTLNNRSGYFLNGTSAGNNTGYVIQPRLPIAVSGTWSGTTYSVFWGITESITERVTDIQNVDLTVQASDLTKYLSLMYLNKPNFYSTYAKSANATHWWRCSSVKVANITFARGAGGTGTYYCQNSFSPGDVVNVYGLPVTSGTSLNVNSQTVATASATQFTLTGSPTGTSTGSGTAILTYITDQIGSQTGQFNNGVAFPNYGAMIYDPATCCDLTDGTNVSTGQVLLPAQLSNIGGLDLWILGQGLNNAAPITVVYSGSHIITLYVDTDGKLTVDVDNSSGVAKSANVISDGFWHHVGLGIGPTGVINLYCDGAWVGLSGFALTGFSNVSTTGTKSFQIGGLVPGLACYLQDIILSSTSMTHTEFENRYVAGHLLQNGYPNQTVYSGDRIAEVLTLAGFGSITNGTVVPTNFYINGSAYPGYGNSANGFIQVEPYYWDTPLIGSTALDIMLQVADTDIGIFFQSPDGKFQYYDQSYYGNWTWNGTTGTWATTYSPPAGNHIWSDDDSSNYSYDGPSLQVVRDDADVWTTVRITPQAGVDQVAETTANEARWGYTTLTKSGTVHPTLNLALSCATYLAYLFRSPLPRVGNVELRSSTRNGAVNTAILGVKIGDPVTFKRTPPNASTSGSYPDVKGQINNDMVVEAIAHDFQADGPLWSASYTLDPYPVRA